MRTQYEIPLQITGYGEQAGTGVATVMEFDRPERWLRALKVLAVAWAAALVSLFIPLAHLLLVPGFLLFGVVSFVRRAGSRAIVSDLVGTCPDCGMSQQFEQSGRWYLPRSLQCRGCRRTLKAVIRRA